MGQECGLRGGRGGPGLETSFVYGDVAEEGREIGGYCRSKRAMLMMRNSLAYLTQIEERTEGKLSYNIFHTTLAKP